MDLLILSEPTWLEIDKSFQWVEFAIPTAQLQHESGHCYVYPWRTTAAKFFAQFPLYSQLEVRENGVPLPSKGVQHHKIRAEGSGSYSMWKTGIYFSTPDNSDPRTNGRKYAVALPSYIQFLESLPQAAIDKHRF